MDYTLLYDELKTKNKKALFIKSKYFQFLKSLKLEFYCAKKLRAYLMKNEIKFEKLLVVLNILRYNTVDDLYRKFNSVFIRILRKHLINRDLKSSLSFLHELYDTLKFTCNIINTTLISPKYFVYKIIKFSLHIYDSENHMLTHRHICILNDKNRIYIGHNNTRRITCSCSCDYLQIPYSDTKILSMLNIFVRYCIFDLDVELYMFEDYMINNLNFYVNIECNKNLLSNRIEFIKNNEINKKKLYNILYDNTEYVIDFGKCLVDIIMKYI